MNQVILVDENDNEIGVEEKISAHKAGKLHRCFTIFVFNSKGELMLQKRAKEKYHSGGLWTNTCCGHQQPGDPGNKTAHDRLQEEMGFDCDLKEIFTFTYRAELDNDITEHELDHVYVGYYDRGPKLNSDEADDWQWITPDKLRQDVHDYPDKYTFWFKLIIERVLSFQK